MDSENLKSNTTDHVVSVAKIALSAVPVVGSPLAEIIGTVIPNQRIERVTKFAATLEERLSAVERQLLQERIHDPDFGELVEDAVRQAASSLSDERRQYLASIVATALSPDKLTLVDSRHLLRILQQINDIEVIVLRSYLVKALSGDTEFRERHSAVLDPVSVHLQSDQREIDKGALYDGYRLHLAQLGLLSQEIMIDPKTKQPAFDPSRKSFKTGDYNPTPLGRLLLRIIGLTHDGFNPA